MNGIDIERLSEQFAGDAYFIVDSEVFRLHEKNLEFLNSKITYLVSNPEASKSLQAVERICNFFLDQKIARSDRIIVIGGGATGDLGGFVASILLRGIDWVCVPTTLLSVVDSSIGGKTGVNTNQGKNLIGSFHLPRKIYFCKDFLKTLSVDQMMSGRGEVLKYAFLSKDIYDEVMNGSEERAFILCSELKEKIVTLDYKEQGERKVLNFGHTLGHVFERLLNVPHGIAVAIGIETILTLYNSDLLKRFYALKSQLEIEYDQPRGLDQDRFFKLLQSDKKRLNANEMDLVLVRDIGKVYIEQTSFEEIKKKLRSYESLWR